MEDRLHAEVSRRLDEKWKSLGSWEAVARDLRTKARKAPTSLDAERLTRITNPKVDTRPSWEECTSLLQYLFGMFGSLPLLELLQRQGNALTLVASHHNAPTTSRWDADARLAIVPDLPQANLEYVPLLSPGELARTRPDWMRAPWNSGWANGRRISRLAFGSPKGCHGTEAVLATIFGVQPFTPATPETAPPVVFLWSRQELETVAPSAFALPIDQVPHSWEEDLVKDWRPMGLAVRTDSSKAERIVFPITRVSGKEHDYGTDYALVAARRDKDGDIAAVCAGISGPATCAAARCLKEFDFPERRDVIYGIVKAEVTFLHRTSDRKLDSYEVIWSNYSDLL